MARAILGETGFRTEDNNQNLKIQHLSSNTRLECFACSARTALGWLGARLILVDEGAVVPEAMWDAIATSAGKTKTTIVVCGTLSPADPTMHWWPKLIARGSGPGVHVQALQGDAKSWSRWSTIRRANPLIDHNPHLKATLRRERGRGPEG